MTVSTDDIALFSPFTVGVSGDFTEADFNSYKAFAALELNRIDPGVDTETYDQLHALMICHMYESSKGNTTQFQSEHIGDYSYTRSGTVESGSTTYYDRILQIIQKWQLKQPTTSTERDDADDTYPSEEFALDQSDVGVFE
jgi:hypothetical protein